MIENLKVMFGRMEAAYPSQVQDAHLEMVGRLMKEAPLFHPNNLIERFDQTLLKSRKLSVTISFDDFVGRNFDDAIAMIRAEVEAEAKHHNGPYRIYSIMPVSEQGNIRFKQYYTPPKIKL